MVKLIYCLLKKRGNPVKLYPEILEMRFMIRYFRLPKGSELEMGSFLLHTNLFCFIIIIIIILITKVTHYFFPWQTNYIFSYCTNNYFLQHIYSLSPFAPQSSFFPSILYSNCLLDNCYVLCAI